MPEEEEVLGEEEATAEEEESGGGGGGGLGDLLDFSGGVMDSMVVKLLVGSIVLVAIILVVIGITNWTLQNIMEPTKPGSSEEEVSASESSGDQSDPLKTLNLENDFIITKQQPRSGRMHTVKVHIQLAFGSDGASEISGELQKRLPQIRDRIYGILGSKEIEELSYRNKQKLQDELRVEINKLLMTSYRVQDIYFTDFVIQ